MVDGMRKFQILEVRRILFRIKTSTRFFVPIYHIL